ncbi:Flp pilus assembly protein CpaB [Pseudodesulfovibrio tunisiensis]|uniref:Flp pilus assembly protein CpaB n=1 Tax=Pseudodesulfovibrio tunisiensis TaxID=463192 RepID=UPI001FB544CF|nr:Flp pilus assembly protein CpaB [Pseudodesulfovibrio tunisiensis]
MSRTARAFIPIILALVLAVVAGLLVFRWMQNMATRQAPAPRAATMPVVVTKVDLSRGATLNADMLEIRQFPKDARPAGAFSEISGLEGRMLRVDVGGNEALTDRKLVDPAQGNGVAALIEPGKRAMSVKGNMVMGLAGFVRPGDRVDVIVTLRRGNGEKAVTKLVLERVKIVATGTMLQAPDQGKSRTAPVDVYTLELTPAESERLALAATQGTLHFALRNADDEETVLTSGETVHSALSAYRPAPRGRTGTVRPRVEIISGGTRKTVRF